MTPLQTRNPRALIFQLLPYYAFCAVLLAGAAAAAEGLYLPPRAPVPEVICEFPDGRLTRAELIAELVRLARAGELETRLYFTGCPPEGFVDFLVCDMLARRQGVGVAPEEIGAALRMLEAEQGGAEQLDWELSRSRPVPLTRADLQRRLGAEKLAQKLGMAGENAAALRQSLGARWHGVAAEIVASADGRDFTVADLGEYFLLRADDMALQAIIGRLLEEKIILAEAEKMGLNTQGTNSRQQLAQIFAPLVTPAALEEYANLRRNDLLVYRLQMLPVTPPTLGVEAYLRQRAQAYNEEPFPVDGAAGYRYFCHLPGSVLSPLAYGLDYVHDARGGRSNPLEEAGAGLYARLWATGVGRAVAIYGEGVAPGVGILCEVIEPRRLTELLPVLREERLEAQRRRLVTAIMELPQTRMHWRPQDRVTPVATPQPAPQGGQSVDLEVLPELEM